MNKTTKYFYILFFIVCGSFNLNVKGQPSNNERFGFMNQAYLHPFFQKLEQLENKQIEKINIVHIGDSHIQADFMTNTIRKILQKRYGNAGYGFTFPYSLAKTNGTNLVDYKSENVWQTVKVISPRNAIMTGLGGITIYTSSDNLKIYVTAKDSCYFNTIKLLYPSDKPAFSLAYLSSISNKTEKVIYGKHLSVQKASSIKPNSSLTEKIYHTVRKNETFPKIAALYKVSVSDLKYWNKTKSNTLKTGTKIIVGTRTVTKNGSQENSGKTSVQSVVDTEELKYTVKHDPYISTFTSSKMLNNTYVIAEGNEDIYYLDGVILENGKQGLLYHSIGINGAKVSDYNNNERFFDQLPNLHPDLIVVSLGTNEAFGKISSATFIRQVLKFIQNVKSVSPDAVVLFTTPPPSLINGKVNTLIQDYATEMLTLDECVVWNMLQRAGGAKAPQNKDFDHYMAKDKIHYSRAGYEMLGRMFTSDLLDSYSAYKRTVN